MNTLRAGKTDCNGATEKQDDDEKAVIDHRDEDSGQYNEESK